MAIPEFLGKVRAKIGNDLLVLPTVAGLVTDERGRVLLIRHTRDGSWVVPGGIVEPDEHPADRLVAEMREETGLDVRPSKLIGVYGGPGCRIEYPNGDQVSCVVSLFACEVVGGTPTPDGEESLEVRFFSAEELTSLNLSTIGRTLLDARREPSRRSRRPRRCGLRLSSYLRRMSEGTNPGPVRSQYENFMRHVFTAGVQKQDRTGTGTVSVFGYQMRFDLGEGFPLVTTKKVHFKSVAYELLWFLRGEGNVRWLQEHGVTIWDEWADENGDLGPVYGVQWRSWPTPDDGHVDQIAEAVRLLQEEPDSRRIIVSAWNVADLPKMALQPCHAFFQLYASEGRLSCQVYQRSADVFLGVPFNIASYALLTHMLAQQTDLEPAELIWTGGDCHIYDNHREQVAEQLRREPYAYPTLRLRRRPASIFDYEFDDFEVVGYVHHPAIRAPVAV